jgi:hypothetical protein
MALYLVGSRQAILDLAGSRWTLVVGLLLVLSGTLARAYDTADLVSEWPVLLHGVGVSLVNSLILYAIVYSAGARLMENKPGFWRGYRVFLGLFWMTAPMAWLYGIPYERFMPAVNAVNANLWTLGLVSLWRVVLITRVLSVIFGASPTRMFFQVMLFSDVAMFLAANLMRRPVLDVMGGLQQTEVERAISFSAFFVAQITFITFLVWLVGALIARLDFKARWAVQPCEAEEPPRAAIMFAGACVLAWVPALTVAQPEQRLRVRADDLLRSGRVHEAFAEMSRHARRDYPPVWDPLPRRAYREDTPSMEAVRAELKGCPPAPWVEHVFMEKSWRAAPRYWFGPLTPESILERVEVPYGLQDFDLGALQFHIDCDPRFTANERESLTKIVEKVKEQEKTGSP